MTEFDQAVDMMAEEAARVIREKNRIIRSQATRIEELEVEVLVCKILTLVFMAIGIAAAFTLLFT